MRPKEIAKMKVQAMIKVGKARCVTYTAMEYMYSSTIYCIPVIPLVN